MKYIKPLGAWLVENSNLGELVRLGLVDTNSLTRIQFRICQATALLIWEKIRYNSSHQPDSVIKKLTIGDWTVLEPGETVYDPTDSRPRVKGSMAIPGSLTLEDIINRAKRLAEHEFIDFVKFIDEACCEWLKIAAEEKRAFDSHGVQLIVSNLTGRALAVDSTGRVDESSNLEQLVRLGLVDPKSLVRIVFNMRKAALGLVWQMIQDGKEHSLASKLEGLEFGDWSVMKPGDTLADHMMGRRPMGTLRRPGNLTVEDLVDSAKRMTREEFLEFCDKAYLDWFKTVVETMGAFDSHGVQMIVSGLTGEMQAVNTPERVNEAGFDQLVQLGIIDPARSNRLEYVANRSVLLDTQEMLDKGKVPAKELGQPFYFVYGYDEHHRPTNSPAGTDVVGSEFLRGQDLAELVDLDFEQFIIRIEALFIDWLKGQPDEYFGKRFGFKGRPLFARDETAAILGFDDWTLLRESSTDNFSKLLSLGLVDPLSQPRVQYSVSDWFMDYMTNLIPGVSSARLWKDDIKAAIIGRVKIYEPGNEEVARWVSLVGLDLFGGPDDIDRIREMELDRDGLRELAGERILGVIKRGFSTNWRTSSSPDPDAEDAGMPTLIKRADQSEWSPFSLNESKEEDLIKLFRLGLIDSVAYISYEINEERLAKIQSEFMDPRASEPAFRKHLIYNVLTESFAWWEHSLPEEAGKDDPSLRLGAIIDGNYWLDEGAISIQTLVREGDEIDFEIPFEELLQEIKLRIVEYLRSGSAGYRKDYKPLYVLDKETGDRYSVKTGEPM